jgi:hypothetical protein
VVLPVAVLAVLEALALWFPTAFFHSCFILLVEMIKIIL